MQQLKAWFNRTFSDPQVVVLALLLLAVFVVIYWLGGPLMPVLASLVIAYLLEAVVSRLQRVGVPRLLAVLVVFLLFMALLVFVIFALVPMLMRQLAGLIQQIPNYIAEGQSQLRDLPERYPQLVSQRQVEDIITRLGEEVAVYSEQLLAWSLASVVGLVSLLVFLVLMPVLVFFFMKDKDKIKAWLSGLLPANRALASSVWADVDRQIGNYVRGKALEILLVGVVSWVTFMMLGLNYAALLATVVGFSVLIPYVGATVATLPVALVAFFQFGPGWEFGQVLIAYLVIQFLDGNVLVPLLFSEVVDLHPVAIIVAILVFGGLWGFWGVFFAIPLATLVQAVLKAWPRNPDPGQDQATA